MNVVPSYTHTHPTHLHILPSTPPPHPTPPGEGLITYIRTDGVTLSSDAVGAIRTAVAQEHG